MNSTNVAVAMGGGQPIDPKAIAALTKKKAAGNSASSEPPKLFEVCVSRWRANIFANSNRSTSARFISPPRLLIALLACVFENIAQLT
jgi:hypothetical protein